MHYFFPNVGKTFTMIASQKKFMLKVIWKNKYAKEPRAF